jgi:hypothetical protein
MTAADAIHLLAERLSRLSPSHREPERYFIEKDEICRELKCLAETMASADPAHPGPHPDAPGAHPVRRQNHAKTL